MPSEASGGPGPPAVILMDAHTVANMWRELKEGITGRPALQELERIWGARWRPGQTMRMAWCRRKAVLEEIARLIQSDLDPAPRDPAAAQQADTAIADSRSPSRAPAAGQSQGLGVGQAT
jgi:hypothetical protein